MHLARRLAALALVSLAGSLLSACAVSPLRVVSGLVSHNLCSEIFVSKLAPERAFAESLAPRPGIGVARPWIHWEVDASARAVTTRVAGGARTQAIARDGLGCLLLQGEPAPPVAPDATPVAPPLLPEIAGPGVVVPDDARLRAALDRAFEGDASAGDGASLRTRAVVIVHAGRVIAERYAPGIGVDTPLLGYSATKSVIGALVGVLVGEGRLALHAPAPVAAWAGAGDPRHAITIDHLLRMTSGLALAESGTPWSPVARMLYAERDMAAYAESVALEAAPGARWDYTSGSTLILSRIVRDAAGGSAEDVVRFARRALFDPLGMRSAVLELDATGTPLGSTYLLASARDWARFGLLLLGDGVVAGRRLLPEGWIAHATTPTLDTGYGASLWTNRVPGRIPWSPLRWDVPGAPSDTFHARGLGGQWVVVVPSRELVIVRLGASFDADSSPGVARLVADAVQLADERAGPPPPR